jgi:ribosomal protein S12 methylthiotransferase accessory factor
MSEITVRLGEGKRVEATVGRHVVHTDQPQSNGGEDTAPAPFDLFLASLGTCAGLYVQAFCRSRGLPTEGITLRQRTIRDPATHALQRIEIDVQVPADFPPRYLEALVRAADQCAVKKAIAGRPEIAVRARPVTLGDAARL